MLATTLAAGVFEALTPVPAVAQRLLGIDISAWQGNITSANWNTLHNTNDRDFVFIRSSRGGTTGFDHDNDNLLTSSANCNGVSTRSCLSNRYDDPYFGQNITRATSAGLFAGPYHRSQANVIASTPNSGGIANSGTDEANHMIQMAGAWMRPGYLPPVLDFEDGELERTDQEMAQFALDFSNRIYEGMGIRPAIYINGNYAQNILAGGTATQRSELARQSSNPPSVVSPAFPTLWSARWPNQANPNAIDVQNLNPTVGFSNIYGPWDDYGVSHPWAFWQYASTARLSGYNNGNSNIDVNVSHGDIEFVKDQLVPALWWNDTSGDWSTLANWNSGQTPVAPVAAPNQSPVQGTATLPAPRLPGAAGSGVTSGQHDTVILERPNANITVTLSSGTHNIRKLYMRESLNITGGSLTVNYDPKYYLLTDPDYETNPDFPNALHSGPISAQFSGPVTISGTGSLSVNTVQVDVGQTFTLAGSSGTLAFKQINLMPDSVLPARIALMGDVNISPLANATATISNGAGLGSSGVVDLGSGVRSLNVADGSAEVDLAIHVPVVNGALTKSGAGTLALHGANSYDGITTVEAGTLRLASATLADAADVFLSTGAALDLKFTGAPDTIDSLFIDRVMQPAGTWGAIGSTAQFTSPLITGTGMLAVSTFVPRVPGDYNGDGAVSAADYDVWRASFGHDVAAGSGGDGNSNGQVDAGDFVIWRRQLDALNPGVSLTGASVPEPATAVFAIGLALLILTSKCGRYRH
jgi:autotransporter-associated beta strand protein